MSKPTVYTITKAESDSKKIQENVKSASLGDEIYTALDPYWFCDSYGFTCTAPSQRGAWPTSGPTFNGRHSDRGERLDSRDIHIGASQCIPIVDFSDEMIILSIRNKKYTGGLSEDEYCIMSSFKNLSTCFSIKKFEMQPLNLNPKTTLKKRHFACRTVLLEGWRGLLWTCLKSLNVAQPQSPPLKSFGSWFRSSQSSSFGPTKGGNWIERKH